jgi:hypothetical protein
MKIVAMSTISDVTDITHSWAEITIWYLSENHVLIIAGSMPALRPFWRTVYGRYTSYKSSSNGDYRSSGKRSGGSRSIGLATIGGTQRKRDVQDPYSVNMPDESSEESLQRKMQEGTKRGKGDAVDSESVEIILPKGVNNTLGGFRVEDVEKAPRGNDIVVTREVHQSFSR